jgi:acyl carrier protein
MQQVEASIREFIAQNFVMARARGAIGADESLMDAGIVDSTGVLELTGFLEEKFGVKVEDAELVPENLDTIANIVAFVARKQGS